MFGHLWRTCVSCREILDSKYRHEVVRDVLFDVYRPTDIYVKIEAHVNFLTYPMDGRSTLSLPDILVFGWVGEKHTWVDLTGVSFLVGLRSRGFTTGHAALKVTACKVAKHTNACIQNQHVLIPFVFDIFGFLAPEAMKLLNRVQQVVHTNVIFLRSITVVFKRISFIIQKRLRRYVLTFYPCSWIYV